MRSILQIILLLYVADDICAQSKAGFEQYAYMGAGKRSMIAPVIHYESNNKWYAEARYNYEDAQVFSLYAGKTFSAERRITWSVTPMIGGMAGKLQGGLAGLNGNISIQRFFFSSQSQYCVSAGSRNDNFFFSWSEAGYQPSSWLYAGISVQHTRVYGCRAVTEPGVMIGFSFREWSFPVYTFKGLGQGVYFILGINREWKFEQRRQKRSIVGRNT